MRRLRRLPIRVRLTLWYVAAFSVIFAAVGLFLVVQLRSTLETNAQESLELTYRGVYDQVAQGTPLATVLRETEIPGETGVPEVMGQILDTGGAVVESSGQAAVSVPVVGGDRLTEVTATGHWHGVMRLPGRRHDDVVFVVGFDTGPHAGQLLVIAQTLAPVSDTINGLRWLLLAAAPVALAIAGAGGWFVARAGLRPVDALTRRAAAIDASTPHDPLPVPSSDDELARLATTLNDMLGRIERALAAERRFTADASHELRTPLAVMEAELDVALRSARTPPEAREVLLSVQDETARLARIVANLLLLARAEAAGSVAVARAPVDVHYLAAEVVARLAPAAADRGVELGVDGAPIVADADRDLLGQAIANLVGNAVTHTDPGGTVTVRVHDGAGDAVIEVADTGCGIPAEELPHVFDRFYRVDPSRDRSRGGSGLGLEITRRIVEAHAGAIDVTSTVGAGSTFTIRLPAPAVRAGGPGPGRRRPSAAQRSP